VCAQCPDCSESRIVYAETHYKCPAVTAWGKCLYRTTEPKFEVPTLPDNLEEHDCASIAGIPFQQRPRLFAVKDTVPHYAAAAGGRAGGRRDAHAACLLVREGVRADVAARPRRAGPCGAPGACTRAARGDGGSVHIGVAAHAHARGPGGGAVGPAQALCWHRVCPAARQGHRCRCR